MNDDAFKEALKKWNQSLGNVGFWGELAKRYGYRDGESMRVDFKNERRRRGIYHKYMRSAIDKQLADGAPRILCFDIETTPLLAFVWGLWNQDVNPNAIVQDWHIISWSAKWLCDSNIMSDVLTSSEAKDHNDKRIVASMWKLLDEADIVIAHNGKRFDVPRLNTRFIIHGMNPTKPFSVIDTLSVAKANFGFSSNRLDYINHLLEIEQKSDTDLSLWIGCFNGDKGSLKKMVEYNKNDVGILEELYMKLRPWIKNHPNMGLYADCEDSVCRNCGSKDLKENGYYYTIGGKYLSFRCKSCGAIGRIKQNSAGIKKIRKLLV